MLHVGLVAVAAAMSMIAVGSARSEPIGFSMTGGGASLLLSNASETASIDELTLTIGDTAYNWDITGPQFSIGSPGNSATLVTPDSVNDGVRSDVLGVTFVNFLPGDRVNLPSDIDPDTLNSGCCRVSGVLFNNGPAPNAVLSLTFSNGHVLNYELTDTQTAADDPDTGAACPVSTSCAWSLSSEVPEPGLALLVGALSAALASRRRARAD